MAISIIPNPIKAEVAKAGEAKKGKGYLWPEIPPATANKIRALAKAAGYTHRDGPKIIVNQLIDQALAELARSARK